MRGRQIVLAGRDQGGHIYELMDDKSLTLAELADVVTQAGYPLRFEDMTPEAFQAAALAAGMPEMMARIVSDTEVGVANGALFDESGTLSRLIG